jgi:DNA-binding CsgD family transcriptional regulator
MIATESPESRVRGEQSPQVRLSAIVGFGLFLSTLLIYSVANLPFAEHPNASFFILFAPCELVFAGLVALVLMVMALAGCVLSRGPLLLVGIACYLISGVVYCLLLLAGSDSLPLIVAAAFITAVGDVLMCLIWGRTSRLHNLKSALVHVSIAGAVSAAAIWLLTMLSSEARMILFGVCLVTAAALAAYEYRHEITADQCGVATERKKPQGASAQGASATFLTLVGLIGIPLLGLTLFAFVMAVMRAQLLETLGIYLVAVVVIVTILTAFVLTRARPLVTRDLQMVFIPLFAILLLTVTSLTDLFAADGGPVTLLLYMLYICAAFLTLSSLAAVARAREFPSDLVFAGALFLFALASAAGQLLGNLIDEQMIDTVVIIVTMLYAFVVMLFSYLRWRHAAEIDLDALPGDFAEGVTDGAKSAEGSHDVDKNLRPDIPGRCAELAAEHRLTNRELEILLILAEGHSGSYISDVLFISANTVRTHIRNIYRKLGVSTREDILSVTRSRRGP